MTIPAYLFFPLASSIAYVVAMLLFKRAGDWGVGLWRTAFVSNLCIGIGFAPLWFLGGHELSASLFWQPLLVAVLFLGGQIFSFLSISCGDVSVATPVLGIKIILVAIGSAVLLRVNVPAVWWLAAGLSTAGVALLSRGASRPRHNVGLTVLTSALGASCFALFDVLIQKWSPAWGVGRFLPIVCGLLALLSFGFIPFFKTPLRTLPGEAWRWLLGGSVLLALQSVLFVYAIGAFGNVTAMNIVYSSRGLWSVAAVWLVGKWFANEEGRLPPAVLRGRLVGSALMLAAIVLVALAPAR